MPILIHASPILIHTLPILIRWLGLRLHILIHTLPLLIHWVDSRLHILTHALPISIHWVSFRLSAPYLNTYNTHLNTLPTRLGSQSESSNPGSRQPIRIEYYVTRVVSQSESSIRHPRALGAWKTLLAIAYLNTLGLPPPPPPSNWSAHTPTTNNVFLLFWELQRTYSVESLHSVILNCAE